MPPLDIKVETLRGFKEYTRVITQGKKYERKPIKAFVYVTTSEKKAVRTGFASIRFVRKAVQRNRLKRLMKEAFRAGKENLLKRLNSGMSIEVVFMYIGNKGISPERVQFISVNKAICEICSSMDLRPN